MSNYPPGVTGNEYQIAGCPERDIEVEYECDECDFNGMVEATEYTTALYRDSREFTEEFECPGCKMAVTRDMSEDGQENF